MHRDIKPENVLVNLNANGQIKDLKLTDFGQSCKIYKNTKPSSKFGTVGYQAPEAIQGAVRFDEKVDSWSLGVILYNMVSGKMPFTGSEKKIKFNSLNKVVQYPDDAWTQCSSDVKKITKAMLQRDSTMRYSINQVL